MEKLKEKKLEWESEIGSEIGSETQSETHPETQSETQSEIDIDTLEHFDIKIPIPKYHKYSAENNEFYLNGTEIKKEDLGKFHIF